MGTAKVVLVIEYTKNSLKADDNEQKKNCRLNQPKSKLRSFTMRCDFSL